MASLRPAHRGYQYQDIVAACLVADSVGRGATSIVADQQNYATDKFDDVRIEFPASSKRFQVKWKDNPTAQTLVDDLRLGRQRLGIDELIQSAIDAPPNSELRVLTTQRVPSPTDPAGLLKPKQLSGTFANVPTEIVGLDFDVLWPDGGQPIWDRLENVAGHGQNVISDACRRIVFECASPRMSGDINAPGRIEKHLFAILRDRIGIGLFPNDHLRIEDVAAQLIAIARSARTRGVPIVPTDALREIGVRMDYGRVPQAFPIQELEVVHREAPVARVCDAANEGEDCEIVGPPGSGKSWLLDQIERNLADGGWVVARHFCYVSVNDDSASVRIKSETMLGNILADLKSRAGWLLDGLLPLYAANVDTLRDALDRICRQRGAARFAIIVDGLDHVDRVRRLRGEVSERESNIVEALKILRDCPDVVLIVGTQPIEAAESLMDGAFRLEMPRWTRREVGLLARNTGLWELVGSHRVARSSSQLLDSVLNKSEGNPLYARYIVRTLEEKLSEAGPRDLVADVEGLPAYGNSLNDYYDYILRQSDDTMVQVAESLACLDFGIAKGELAELTALTPSRLDTVLGLLRPILSEVVGRGGVRIYHDSFRQFVLDSLRDPARDLPQILGKIIDWLRGLRFFADARAFRHLPALYVRAGRGRELLASIDKSFVVDSVGHFHAPEAIRLVLARAVEVAVELRALPELARLAELQRTLHCVEQERLEWHLGLLGRAFGDIHGYDRLAERLLYDGRPTFQAGDGLLLCDLCETHGATPPWREYLTQKEAGGDEQPERDSSILRFKATLHVHTARSCAGRLIRYLRERTECSGYVERLIDAATSRLGESVLMVIERDTRVVNDIKDYCILARARRLAGGGDQEQLINLVGTVASRTASIHRLLACVNLIGVDAIEEEDKSRLRSDCVPPQGDHHDILSRFSDWFATVRVCAHFDGQWLAECRRGVQGSAWFFHWQRFVLGLGTIVAEIPAASPDRDVLILQALANLAEHDDRFDGPPRACDLYHAHDATNESFEFALGLLDKPEALGRALETLLVVSRNTSTSLMNDRDVSGPLAPDRLGEIAMKWCHRDSHKQVVSRFLRELAHKEFQISRSYATHTGDFLRASIAASSIGDTRLASDALRRAGVFICGYGGRKDVTVWDTFEGLPIIGDHLSGDQLGYYARSQRLSDLVLFHTDGKETQHAPNQWLKALFKTDPARALFLLAIRIGRAGGGIDGYAWDALVDVTRAGVGVGSPTLSLLLNAAVGILRETGGLLPRVRREMLGNGAPGCFDDLVRSYVAVGCEAASPDKAAVECLRAFATESDLSVRVPVATPPVEQPGPEFPDTVTQKPLVVAPQNWAVFPITNSPEAIAYRLRELSRPGAGAPPEDAMVNALGYRLAAIANGGASADEETALGLLFEFAEAFRYSDVERYLTRLGEGFERLELNRMAAAAFMHARYRRNRDWWWSDDDDGVALLRRAVALCREAALETVVQAVGSQIRRFTYTHGTPTTLIRTAMELGRPEVARAILDEALDVVELRLPHESWYWETWLRCDDQVLDTLDCELSLACVVVSLVCRPDPWERMAALTAVALLLRTDTTSAIGALRFRLNADITTLQTIMLLEAVRDFEPPPFDVTKGLADLLHLFVRIDCFYVARLAAMLLARADIDAPPFRYEAPIATTRNVGDMLANTVSFLDHSDRLQLLEDSGLFITGLTRSHFAQTWNSSESHQRRVERSWEEEREVMNPEMPGRTVVGWDDELFEFAFQRALNEVPPMLMRDGEFDEAVEERLLAFCDLEPRLNIGLFLSRTARPEILRPCDAIPGLVEIDTCASDDDYSGWIRLATYEAEFVRHRSTDEKSSNVIVRKSGAIPATLTENIPDGATPFGRCHWRYIWKNLNRLEASSDQQPRQIVLFDKTDTAMGQHPILGLSHGLVNALRLRVSSELGRLALKGKSDNEAIVYRWWRAGEPGSYSRRKTPTTFDGCELLLHPDLLTDLTEFAGMKLFTLTTVSRTDFQRPK